MEFERTIVVVEKTVTVAMERILGMGLVLRETFDLHVFMVEALLIYLCSDHS